MPPAFFSLFFQKIEVPCMPVHYRAMKYRMDFWLLGALLPLALVIAACDDGPIRASYRPLLPEMPRHWEEIMGGPHGAPHGEPHWRLEWLDSDGVWQERDLAPGRNAPELSPMQEWSSPVLAWPYWPSRNLLPGMMKPAGAIFPWDVSGDKLRLSWRGGVEAVFWKELAAAEKNSEAAQNRVPWYLDWPRFRELLDSGDIPEDVRGDPWLADWKDIAARTVQSGFDRRRIRSRAFTEVAIPGIGGLWIASSPFAPPLDAGAEGPLRVRAAGVPDTWVSSGAVLRCSAAGWVFSGF